MFSADQLIIQKRKLDVLITKPCRCQFEATVLIKSSYYIVPSPSTALPERILNMVIPAEPQRTESMDKMAKQSPTPPIAIRQWGIAILQY